MNLMQLRAFVLRRFDRTTFIGLPLLLLSILFLVFLFVFFDLIEDILASEQIIRTDLAMATFLASLRTPFFTSFFLFVTELGSSTSVLVCSLLAGISYLFVSRKRYVFPFLTTAFGVTACISATKFLVARERPGVSIYFYLEKLFSFPSGHAASTLAIFGFIAYVWMKTVNTPLFRSLILIGTVALVGAIGFSRLYLGLHYVSDVVGGYILGALWLIIGICITELFTKNL